MIPELLVNYGPRLLQGLVVTLELVALSAVLGGVLAIPVTAARMSRHRAIAWPAAAYVYFFRGTPLLAQLFLVYYGAGQFVGPLRELGLWTFFRDAFNCAVLAFTLNTAAYQAEIYRGALASVPKGQREAALSLGLGRGTTLLKVIGPQAAIVALRPLGNELILLIKASATASIVTVLDLMGETRIAFSRTYDLTIYLWAAVLYLIMVEAIRRLWGVMERRLTRHLVRATRPSPTEAAGLVALVD